MARTHKDRHKWKAKERKKTGQKNPRKIVLHRARFLERLEQKSLEVDRYKSIVFRTRLNFNTPDGLTEIFVDSELVGEAPFLVVEPADCEYVLAGYYPDFKPAKEEAILKEHVDKMKFFGEKCHLVSKVGEIGVCASAVKCKYRRWRNELGLPECRLSINKKSKTPA